MSPSPPFTVRVASSIRSIPAAAWDACAFAGPVSASTDSTKLLRGLGEGQKPESKSEVVESLSQLLESKSEQADSEGEEDSRNPFISHDFLSALEDSGTVSAMTGWAPQHVLVEDAEGVLAAAMPCYLKAHSHGEYVFDHGWAEAYERAGGDYYPKLQAAVPFTPVTGPRLLVRPGARAEAARAALIAGSLQLAHRRGVSSLHVTFPTAAEWNHLSKLGFLARTDRQFHWLNEGYRSFDDFLARLASRKRKVIERERRAARDGVEIVHLTGADLTEQVWDDFFSFYMDTGSRKWGLPYLNREFFSRVGERMSDKIVLMMARRDGRHIAGALNFLGSQTLYGRYWGAVEHRPFLHFELCYYQAIEYAIEHRLARIEAGAQGPHKIARGYVPATTYSAHWIADPALARAVADYLARERAYVEAESEELAAFAPFRKDGVQ
jgi:predicted N-acyltransferase